MDIPSRPVCCEELEDIKEASDKNKFVLAYFGTKTNPLFEKTFLKFAGSEDR